MTDDKENTPDASGAWPGPAPDGGSEVTPLFTAADEVPGGGPPEQDHQSAVSDQVVREQVQRVRLDLLARETERLDRRLAQILEQQMEDRQLRERLQTEVGNLCQRVDQLLGAAESGAAGGGAGADLRTTVKPLLQAVLDMLDGPAENRKSSDDIAFPQRQQVPLPGQGSGASAPAMHSTPPSRAEATAPTARPADSRPAGPGLPPTPGAARPPQSTADRMPPPPQHDTKPRPQHWSAEEVEARAVALQRALSRLDQATKPATPRPPPPMPAPAPSAAPPQLSPEPAPAPSATPPQFRPEPPPTPSAAPPQPRPEPPPAPQAAPQRPDPVNAPAAPTFERRVPDPAPGPEPMDEMADSLRAEDPTIEIARLLRPVEARTQRKPEVHRPRPAADSAAYPPAARQPVDPDPDPLLLGTSETPEIGGRAERSPPPSPGAGAGGQNVAGRTDLARRAREMAASDRSAAAAPGWTPGGPDSAAPQPPVSADKRPEPPAASAAAGPQTEPLGEALPRCLTEPWDDPDPGRPRAGQDKGSRRWPFRRGRPGDDAAGQRTSARPASHGRRTRPDDGTEWPE